MYSWSEVVGPGRVSGDSAGVIGMIDAVGLARSSDCWRQRAFFLPATVRFGPLRVRALVLVR